MPFASVFSEAILQWLVQASWQIALLVAIVAVATRLLRKASPRLRHALWLLVLLKAVLPPSLATDWSIGRWGVGSAGRMVQSLGVEVEAPSNGEPLEQEPAEAPKHHGAIPTTTLAAAIWAVGAVTVWALVIASYLRVRRRVGRLPEADEGPLAVALEEAALSVKAPTGVELRIDDAASSPYLLGLRRPRIVLPQNLVESLPAAELRGVLAHELLHWRRRDIWIGWLQAAVQGLFWFHPLVWWSAAQLRHERECACDEAVLRSGASDPTTYGAAIVHTLTAARGAAPPVAPLVGVFEHGSLLQQRLEEVMSYSPDKRRFGWLSRLGLAAFALVALPMAGRGLEASADDGGLASAATAKEIDEIDRAAAELKARIKARSAASPYPIVIETVPEVGATAVNPSLDEIRVTFDRDMTVGMNYSWTGDDSSPEFPPLDKSRQPHWIDSRTCVLPVHLAKGKFYRVGINSKSFQNFKSADGKPAEHSVIAFATEGAKRSVARKAHVPKIVELTPANGDGDVDPSLKTISVTFDTKMGGGMSWVRTGGAFPGSASGRAWWSKDGKTCTLPVELEPDVNYALSLNGSHYINFQSRFGVPLPMVEWSFSTRAE